MGCCKQNSTRITHVPKLGNSRIYIVSNSSDLNAWGVRFHDPTDVNVKDTFLHVVGYTGAISILGRVLKVQEVLV